MKRLQNFGLVLVFLFASLSVNSQDTSFEIKIDPLLSLFEVPVISVEKIVKPNWGIEGQFRFIGNGENAASLSFSGKYYFNPKEVANRFYVGSYARIGFGSDVFVALGPIGGFKWGNDSVIFDLQAGVGRKLGIKDLAVDPQISASIGYRFNKK